MFISHSPVNVRNASLFVCMVALLHALRAQQNKHLLSVEFSQREHWLRRPECEPLLSIIFEITCQKRSTSKKNSQRVHTTFFSFHSTIARFLAACSSKYFWYHFSCSLMSSCDLPGMLSTAAATKVDLAWMRTLTFNFRLNTNG